jgi:putative ATPase
LNVVELSAKFCEKSKIKEISLPVVELVLSKKQLYHDKGGEEHYNILSAFIKSMRGGDPNAAIYWMCRLLEAGEDPLLIARRMVIFASEDIGNADPQALLIAVAAMHAVDFVGMPEAKIPLAQGVTYLATAKKSNASYMALQKATEAVHKMGNLDVPLHLKNAVTPLMKQIGYGKGYQYAHHYQDAKVSHEHLPSPLKGSKFYTP